MLRVNPLEIRDGESIPYNVYSADGALLYAEGEKVTLPEQAIIMRTEGWRDRLDHEEQAVAEMSRLDDATGDDAPRLPMRERPPLAEAEVLIAEDMKLARDLLIKMLNEQGITNIVAVDNGHSAITHFFQYRPHIVFLDIYMPPNSGFDVLRQVKRWTPDNFVCMASGDCSLANAEQARSLGVDAFIIKPISLLNLKRILALYSK